MKENIKPTLPPALRKARPAKELSDAFPPIIARPRPEPPPPAPAPIVAAEPTPTQSAPAAVVPPAPPQPKKSAPAPVSPKPALAPPLTRPKPTFKGRSPVAELDGREVMFAGTFRPDGEPDFEVETRLTGDPRKDRQAIINLARKRFPTGGMNLRHTRIYSRETGVQVSYPKGISVGQLFGESGSLTENALEIGSVFWGGERCSVILVNLRSRGSVNINLRQPGGARVSFSNQIAANTQASTLKHVVKEVLGQEARELSISLKIES